MANAAAEGARQAGARELMARVWPDVLVEPANLSVHFSALRGALRDGRDGNRFIINIPGRRYCFMMPISSAVLPEQIAFSLMISYAIDNDLTAAALKPGFVTEAEFVSIRRRWFVHTTRKSAERCAILPALQDLVPVWHSLLAVASDATHITAIRDPGSLK
jgi:hypothetical protein